MKPRLVKWVERAGGEVSYRVTQIFTGHARCHHCDEDEDTAQHTLKLCQAWAEGRRVLVQKIDGNDLSLSGIIAAMLERRRCLEGDSVKQSCCRRMRPKERGSGRKQRGAERTFGSDPTFDAIRPR